MFATVKSLASWSSIPSNPFFPLPHSHKDPTMFMLIELLFAFGHLGVVTVNFLNRLLDRRMI